MILVYICFWMFAAVGVWNLIMMILFWKTRKSGGEKHEKSRSRFAVSSSFFSGSLILLIAAFVITEMFIQPIFYM
ncbi:MAG: hypothetical protein NC078_07295 [Ruminococcus sp.]|nr:hypothetical protein [Ruminococcus sp.]